MFDPLSRFILARGLSKSIDPAAFSCTPVVAYAMFRFDREAKQNVVYWCAHFFAAVKAPCYIVHHSYELQVSVAARRLRLGQHLMKQLERIGRGTGMSKVMLTVQKGAPTS